MHRKIHSIYTNVRHKPYLTVPIHIQILKNKLSKWNLFITQELPVEKQGLFTDRKENSVRRDRPNGTSGGKKNFNRNQRIQIILPCQEIY